MSKIWTARELLLAAADIIENKQLETFDALMVSPPLDEQKHDFQGAYDALFAETGIVDRLSFKSWEQRATYLERAQVLRRAAQRGEE